MRAKEEGSDIGLAITHSIIKKHGGHISVQSTPGVGTSFTIYLPASTQSSLPIEQDEATPLSARNSTILVMDDEEQIRIIAQAMLRQMGHEVILAEDGSEALELYKKKMNAEDPIDLTIMDLTIPGGMGGQETVQKILSINPEAKIIVSSGYSNDQVMANFKNYGFCAAIAKPYQLPELAKTINQAIRQSS